MKYLIVIGLLVSGVVGAAKSAAPIDLFTPNTVPLSPPVSVTGCAAGNATVDAYRTVVTGFSTDGNYVLGQVTSHFTCGHSGRGATIHTYHICTTLQWNLTGALVGTHTPTLGASNIGCPPITFPQFVPPATSEIGNSFENAGGYVAQTFIQELCGSIACYGLEYEPQLIQP